MSDTMRPPFPPMPGTQPKLLITATLLVVLGVSSAYALYNALLDRSAQLAAMQASSRNLSALLDREVETSRALLSGLSSSPLIAQEDFGGFHQQMINTRRPDGVALTLSDLHGQLANVLRPYGEPLPRLSDFDPQPGFFERLENEGFHVSSRVVSRLNGASSTVVSIGVPGPGIRLKYILSLAIGETRINEILQSEMMPEASGYMVIDAKGNEIANLQRVPTVLATATLSQQVAIDPGTMEARTGTFRHADQDSTPYWTAYSRSELTGWTVAVTKPKALVERQLQATILPIAGGSGLVGLSILGLYLYWRRRVATPFRDMNNVLSNTREQLSRMQDDFSNLRQSEHRRIAQELHDTTAQRLVAADLHLSALRHADPSDIQGLLKEISGIQAMIEQSLKELRSFAFLLRPVELSSQGFDTILKRLFQVFADRAGLEVQVSVDPDADRLPVTCKDAIYRVSQEALMNIHRHARANHVSAHLSRQGAAWLLAISDDGIGGITFPQASDGLGLGVLGISEVLADLGGALSIQGNSDGTELRATLPAEPGS